MNAVIVVIEHICTVFYAIPSVVAFPLSACLLGWQFLANAVGRRDDARRAMQNGSSTDGSKKPLVAFYGAFAPFTRPVPVAEPAAPPAEPAAPPAEAAPPAAEPPVDFAEVANEAVAAAVERAKAETLAATRLKEQQRLEQQRLEQQWQQQQRAEEERRKQQRLDEERRKMVPPILPIICCFRCAPSLAWWSVSMLQKAPFCVPAPLRSRSVRSALSAPRCPLRAARSALPAPRCPLVSQA